MLALPVDMDKFDKYIKNRYSMEVKLDGIRCIAFRDPVTGFIQMYSRTGKPLHPKLPHLVDELNKIPGVWVLDGELGYPLHDSQALGYSYTYPGPYAIDFNATSRVLGSGVEEALRKQEENEGAIEFFVFDILRHRDTEMSTKPQIARYEVLRNLLARTPLLNNVHLSQQWLTWNETVYNDIVRLGGEGVMLKNPLAFYHRGARRANTWYKVKAFDTVDGKIVDYVLGKGKYGGQVGALVIEDSTGTRFNVSGMDDSARADMTVNFDHKYKGKMVEIKYFGKVGKDKTGYRHPNFLRMRPDLD